MAAQSNEPHGVTLNNPIGIDADELMERVRENIRKKKATLELSGQNPSLAGRSETDASERGGGVRNEAIKRDLALLYAEQDLTQAAFKSHRKLLGPLIIRARELVRDLMLPVLDRQASYNRMATRLFSQISKRMEEERMLVDSRLAHELDARTAALTEVQAGLCVKVNELREEVDRMGQYLAREASFFRHSRAALRDEITGQSIEDLRRLEEKIRQELLALEQRHAAALEGACDRISAMERHMRRIALGTGGGRTIDNGAAAQNQNRAGADFDYAGFARQFRGDAEEIKGKLAAYVPYFQGRNNVLDLGCGGGEFLDLMKEAGIEASGVDRDIDMVLMCRERTLEAAHDDALHYLEEAADSSLGGIFSAQFIEHLPVSEQIRLISLAHRKLKSGGVCVFETLNPESIYVLYRWFWMDPTHTRLIHPETLRFLMESAGFETVEIRFVPRPSGPVEIPPLEGGWGNSLQGFNRATAFLNQLLYGSWEYATIGRKQ